MSPRKPKKGKGKAKPEKAKKPGLPKRALLVGKVRIGEDAFKDLFKGRKVGDFSISEDSHDEQVQGFLLEMSEKAPKYVERGAFIVQGKDGRWKVNVFGGDDFEHVLGDVIRVALLGLAQGAEE